MEKELKYWLFTGFLLVILAWGMAIVSCVSRPKYTPSSEVLIELPHTPADTLKGGAR